MIIKLKIKINPLGILEIERGGKFKPQSCPYQPGHTFEFVQPKSFHKGCGDWCPLFGEPKGIGKLKYPEHGDIIELKICNKSFTIGENEFTDERQ